MIKKALATSIPSLTRKAIASAYLFPGRRTSMQMMWFWLTLVIIVGLVISGVIALMINYWFNNTHPSLNSQATAAPIVSTLSVQRSSLYAGLEITVKNAQSAHSFADDSIPARSGVVRLNLKIANHTNNRIDVLYYEVTRLLAPGMQPASPLNVHLAASMQPGKEDNGWIDFAVPDHPE